MNARTERGLAAMSAIGATVFIGIFTWMYLTEMIPVDILIPLAFINLVVGVYSAKLAITAGS